MPWTEILQWYDRLLVVNYSPAAALNRIFALYKVKGAKAALAEVKTLQLEDNHFYFVLLGELYQDLDKNKAIANFNKAKNLAKITLEKEIIQQKIDAIKSAMT